MHRLLESAHPLLSNQTISVLIRGPDRAAKLQQVYGSRVAPILFNSLDDIDLITEAASQHDIVINAGTGFHASSAGAIVRALSKRQHETSGSSETRKPWVIHTSGGSNTVDNPLAGDAHPDRWFDDADPETVYEYQKAAEAREPYAQRTAELAVLDASEETGVGAVVLQIPCIFGEGAGLFSASPMLECVMIRYVLDRGYGYKLGEGTGRIGVVHVDDLAQLYILLVQRILEDGGKDLPSGKRGTIFPSVGMAQFADIAWACVRAAFRKGILPKKDGPQTEEVRLQNLDDVAPFIGEGKLGKFIAASWAGHWNTIGTVAFKLGWQPTHLMDVFSSESRYDTELEEYLAGRRGSNFDSVTGHAE